MGAANSKIEEDKALQLCRERKKFVRQALDGRCSLAADHVAYIQSLQSTGAALKRFVQPEGHVQSSLSTSRAATPEPFALTEKSSPMVPFTSPVLSRGATAEYLSHSPSPPNSRHFQTNHMKFRGSVIRQIEQRPPTAVTGTVTSSSTPQSITSCSNEGAEKLPFSTSAHQSENPPWDYFGLFEPADNQFPSHGHRELANTFDKHDDERQIREEEGIPELEDEDEKVSSKGRGLSQDSEDEFDEPMADTLVRSFQNLNQHISDGATVASPTALSAESTTPRKEFVNGNKIDSPKLSPLRAKSSDVPADVKMTTMKDEEVDGVEHKVAPKDFFQSMKDVDDLFTKASDSGKEVPRMLEANKFHYRPIIPGKERGSIASIVLKACLSCGEDRSHIQEDAAQNTMKYLTWHRTTSSRSSSSRNPLAAANPRDDAEDISTNLFESSCMISGSHASTLDRLYAWERKLYDEVKASQIVRRDYDTKCKLLRLQESKGESSHRIDKTRADVKDLHSRIRVAILRIDSISKRIEELRDQELQPQLEELIEGLRRMWETMRECHNLQLHVISIAKSDYQAKIFLNPELHHEVTTDLKNQLGILSSSFTKWVSSQKSYMQAINNWLLKSVSIPPKFSKRKSRVPPPPLSKLGPPIYTTCSVWLEKLETLPTKEVANAIKGLAAETSRFLPSQEKGQGKKIPEGADPELEMLNGKEYEDRNVGYDHFRSSLINFLGRLCAFADVSLRAYGELQNSIEAAKRNSQHPLTKQ